MFVRLCASLLLTAMVSASTPTHAYPPRPRWDSDHKRLTTAEWLITPSLALGSLGVRFLGPRPRLTWEGGVLFDEVLYLAIAPQKHRPWRTIADVSHVGFATSIAYRVIDDLLIVGASYDAWDVGWQMFGMDLQAATIIATSLWLPQLLIGRERPILRNCGDEARASNKCDADNPERNRSFWAGHPALAVATAGMTCSHHARLQIYGGGFPDHFACGATIALATFTTAARAIAGYHWPSDVLLGVVVGNVAWLVPVAVHYGFTDHPRAGSSKERRMP